MNLERQRKVRSTVSACLGLWICISGVSFVAAQQRPVEFASQSDDKQLCSSDKTLNSTEYCEFWRLYTANRANSSPASRAIAADARNELIKYVQGRVDRYYEERTNKKEFNRKLLQTILDVLEISAAAAIGITNGERAKEVIGISLGALQATRTSFNKNFQLLQTRILVNKMRENRAAILTRIVANMFKPVSDYSWLDAKNDLRQYLYAGTFNNALDSLAAETGEAAQKAEKDLRTVSGDLEIVQESTADSFKDAEMARDVLAKLKEDLADANTRSAALNTLKAIVEELKKDSALTPLVETRHLSEESDGEAIISGIILIRRQAAREAKGNLARTINQAIVRVANRR